ncbi:MAG: hypothetical protein RIQ41_415 [Candidatus Parcubacteria bacterium]|jgi:Ni/Fe-hydrogenase subunit HybB-like protein
MNAIGAWIYILMVVGVIYTLQSPNTPDHGILAPVFLLSLFTLSATVMAFLFFYEPCKLYFDNKRKEALVYFMKTLGFFAVMVVIFWGALLYSRTAHTITFPQGGERLVQGQTYTLTWTGGREEVTQIFLVDTALKEESTSASISDRIYGIENKHQYTYTIPKTVKPGTYEFQIGSQTSAPFEIVSK